MNVTADQNHEMFGQPIRSQHGKTYSTSKRIV